MVDYFPPSVCSIFFLFRNACIFRTVSSACIQPAASGTWHAANPALISSESSDSICFSSAMYSTSGQKQGASNISIILICKDIFTRLDRVMLLPALKASRIRHSNNCQGKILGGKLQSTFQGALSSYIVGGS